ncbi:YopX family protein [Enterococcus gilvus]|uniref:YopX family protein n=1 Tax=Enterococcus gilvus TaxID=160453 RepID=UPI001C8C120C|nr:YopX family protein [Enterococcus gilvus]MBX8939225.1 hypothetical protein [Enterococcus gilvus]
MIPKYRVWNETAGLANVINIDFREKELKVSHWEYGDSIYFPLDEVELMQSTGLKGYMSDSHEDDEEKDVYRGDIIDIFWEEWPMGYYQENHMIGVVDKDETGTAWIIKDAKYDFDTPKPIPSEIDGISVSMSLPDAEDLEEIFLHNFNLTSSDITILGNIYENPELLEEI